MIDVSDVIASPEFATTINVNRRSETIGTNGRVSVTTQSFANVRAIVYPTPPNQLQRDDDKQLMGKTITIVTLFRLQGPSSGVQPDTIVWNGSTFLVNSINDYGQFGAGFIEATASSIDSVDQSP